MSVIDMLKALSAAADNVKKSNNGKVIFVIKLKEDFDEKFTKDKLYFVGSDVVAASVYFSLLTKIVGDKAYVDLWADSNISPEGSIVPDCNDSCEDCETQESCEGFINQTAVRECKNMQTKEKPTATPNTEGPMAEHKPDGLRPDTSISDLLLGAFEAMNKGKKPE